MCDFCNNVIKFIHWYDKISRLVKDNNCFSYWIEVDDKHYSGTHYLSDIKYCPYCGRKLND